MHVSSSWDDLSQDLQKLLREAFGPDFGKPYDTLGITQYSQKSDDEFYTEFLAILDERKCTRTEAYNILAERYGYVLRHVRRRIKHVENCS